MSNIFDSEDFISKLKAKDRDAFEALVKAYTSHIYNASLGLGFGAAESDDLTQSVWLTFFDVVEKFEGRSKVKTFYSVFYIIRLRIFVKRIKKLIAILISRFFWKRILIAKVIGSQPRKIQKNFFHLRRQ